MGHEIAHITLGHHDEAAQRRGATMVLEAISYVGLRGPLQQQAADLAFQAFESKHSRDAERQSDYLGVIWAVEAGYDAAGAAELHRKFQARANNHPIPFLSSHPSSAERIVTLQKLARDLARTPSLPDS